MITQAPNSGDGRINVLDSSSERYFRTWKTKKPKIKQQRNRLPILALNRCNFEKPRINFEQNDSSYLGQYSWVKCNLLPNPSSLDSLKVGKLINVTVPEVDDPNIQVSPDVISPLVENSKKVGGNEITEVVPKIILPLPSEDTSLPAITEVISVEKPFIESTETIKVVDDIPKENKSELPEDLEYLLDKEVLNYKELLLLGQYNLTFLVEHLIPVRSITFLAGPSDTGKSTFALQIATSIIQGKPDVIGKKITAKHNRVIYISTEDGSNQLGNRLGKQRGSNCPDILDQQFRSVPTMELLVSELEIAKVDLVIIDTFPDFFKGEINSATAVRQFFNEEIKPLMKKYDFTCLILHHIGKNKSKVAHKDQLVGSQSIEAASRQVLYLLEGKRPHKVLKIVKGNYVPYEVKKEEIILELNPETLLFSKVENTVSTVNPGSVKNPYTNLAAIDSPAQPKKRRNGPSTSKLEKLAELDNEGHTLEEMAKILGCKSASTVRNWLIIINGQNYSRKKD